ncbi:MAG: site-2 protease family protein, partial [Coleofasciculus sp. C2-GNP5-27]
MSILAAIAVLAVLIEVHELGHFMAARLQGIYANRFSLGFGPVLWKYQGPDTEYAIRAFPLGGFVGFPDDDPDSEIPPDDPNLLRNRPVLDRAIVISAGVIANLIFA